MESLSGNSRNSLMEAYTSIYSDDHIGVLSEEQTLNEFYEDINSLLREGYDLSDYTYDELYGVYVTENRLSGILNLLKSAGRYARGAFRTGIGAPAGQTARSTIAKGIIGSGAENIGKLTRDVAKVPGAITGSIYRGVRGYGQQNPLKAAGLAGLGALGLYDLSKGSQSLIGKAANLGGQAISGITGAAQGAGKAIGDLDRAVYGGDSTPSSGKPPTEGIHLPAGYRLINGNVVKVQEDYDLFDIIMNHLLYEGYTDSEEGAAVIMANMSEEWKQSIVEAYVPWDAPRYVWDKGVQVLTGRPSPRDVTAARQTQQTPERAKQLARVQANMRYGMQQVYKRTGEDPAKEGTAPLTPRHIRSAQTVGGTAGGKMYPGPQGKPQPSGIPSIKVPSTPELRRQNTAAQLRQALRTGRGMSGSMPNVGTPSGMPTPSGATGPYYPGSAPGYGIGQTKLAN